jgi:hypothetical protein
MNTKNYDFLKDSLKYLGFGDKLNDDLQKHIEKQPADFQLNMTGEYKKGSAIEKVNFTLDFKKSDQTDMYFFNRYKATLTNDNPEKEKSQTFYIQRNAGITAKEAYNLLSGRAVNKDLTNKEDQPYNAWLQLNFSEKDKNDNHQVRQYHASYGYDVNKTLDKFPIKELNDAEQREKVVKSLEKGNLTEVTFTREGKEDKMFVEAVPQYKSLNVYDASMKKQFQENDRKVATDNGQDQSSKEKKESTKKTESPSDEATPQKKSKRKGIGV